MGSTLIEFENHGWDVLGKMGAASGYEYLRNTNVRLPEYGIFEMMLSRKLEARLNVVKENLKEIRFEDVASSLFEELKVGTSDGKFTTFLREYYRPITQQATLIEGAVDILAGFKKSGVRLGLVSNTIFRGDFHREELKRFGLYPFLDAVLFSCEFGYRKPDPRIFKEGLKQLGIGAQEAVFIGDRLMEDVEGAQRAGMKAILKYKPGRDYSAVPDGRVDNLDELPFVVEKLGWD